MGLCFFLALKKLSIIDCVGVWDTIQSVCEKRKIHKKHVYDNSL